MDERPVTPQSRPIRMTRSQLAKQEQELGRSLHSHAPGETETGAGGAAAADTWEPLVLKPQGPPAPESPREAAAIAVETHARVVRLSAELVQPEPKTLTSERPCEEEATTAMNLTPSQALSRSSSRSPSKTPMRLEESIGAIDALEEALENVGKDLPRMDQLADEKSPKKAHFTRDATRNVSKTTTKTSHLSTKISKAPIKAPNFLKPVGTSRASSVRLPPKDSKGSGTVTGALTTKLRPISMTFAAPVPPVRSTKPLTKPAFHLSGEAAAVKLEAQKAGHLKRESRKGPVKQRPMSMPPPPKSTRPLTKPAFQLSGEEAAAKLKAQREERLKRAAKGNSLAPHQVVGSMSVSKSSKPPTVPNFQLPGEAVAAKLKTRREERLRREEEAGAARKAALQAKSTPVRKFVAAPVRPTAAGQAHKRMASKDDPNGLTVPSIQRSASSASKRDSMVLSRTVSLSSAASANSSKRNGIVMHSGPVAKSTVTPADAAALKTKGREVFNRDLLEKEARDQERREKEEAAKKARAEAAERGRIASREWAERQKKKLMATAATFKKGTAT